MSSKHRGGAGALVALAAIGASAPTTEGLPDLKPGEGADPGPGEGANASAEFVESDVVAMNRALREEVERLRADVVSRDRGLDEMHARFTVEAERLTGELDEQRRSITSERAAFVAQRDAQRADFGERMREQNAHFDREWARRERELGGGPAPRTRLVFDASVPGIDAQGAKVIFAPGDPVPAHINPDTLPAHAVKRVEES